MQATEQNKASSRLTITSPSLFPLSSLDRRLNVSILRRCIPSGSPGCPYRHSQRRVLRQVLRTRPRRLDVRTVVVPTSTVQGVVSAAVLDMVLADLAHAELAAAAHAGVTDFSRAELCVSAQELLAAEERLIAAGLLVYPRAVVVSPGDAALFGDFAWLVAVGPGQLRAVFMDLDEAVQWARDRAVTWWANGRTRASD